MNEDELNKMSLPELVAECKKYFNLLKTVQSALEDLQAIQPTAAQHENMRNVLEKRLFDAGWLQSANFFDNKGMHQLLFTPGGLNRMQTLFAVLGELGFFPDSNKRLKGESEILFGWIGCYGNPETKEKGIQPETPPRF